jgi:hypothetical protein
VYFRRDYFSPLDNAVTSLERTLSRMRAIELQRKIPAHTGVKVCYFN